jgi:hypothetical protein
VVLQAQVPEWLTNQVLSLPITTLHGTPTAGSNSTQLNEPEPSTFLGDPDTNQLGYHFIQVCYSMDSQMFLALIDCLRVEYQNRMPPPGLSLVMLQYPQFRNICLNTSHQSCLNLRQWPTGALESPIVITGG